jgi:CofH subfamily radical SAM domain protein
MSPSDKEALISLCPQELHPIAQKVIDRTRLSTDDGLLLFSTPHLSSLQALADFARRRSIGDAVFYASTLHIYPTNLCELSCPMCSFYAKPGSPKAWFLEPQMIEEKVRAALPSGISEVHIVSGLWKECTLDYYKEVFQRIRALDRTLHIKALTPVEYDFLAKIHYLSVQEVLKKMISWGLSSIPGGGAEILNDEIRKKVAPGKISSQRFLDIHKEAHMLGLPTNVSMLFGHIENESHILEHLDKIRQLQDLTFGFHTFVPLKYHCENNALGKIQALLKPKDSRRIYAISRLMLDNVPNIKVLWNYMDLQAASEILFWGANDIGSVTSGEQVATLAGGVQMTVTEEILENVIRSAGRSPMKVHSAHTLSTSNRSGRI